MKAFILLDFLLFVTNLGYSQQVDVNDYLVYSAIIKRSVAKEKKSIVILNKTMRDYYEPIWFSETTNSKDLSNNWMSAFKINVFDSSAYLLYKEFNSKIISPKYFKKRFSISFDAVLISKAAFNGFFDPSYSNDGWDDFYIAYSNSAGCMGFSDIHYSLNKKKAIAYYFIKRNGFDGKGAIAILEVVNGSWEIAYDAELWVN